MRSEHQTLPEYVAGEDGRHSVTSQFRWALDSSLLRSWGRVSGSGLTTGWIWDSLCCTAKRDADIHGGCTVDSWAVMRSLVTDPRPSRKT